MPEIRKLDPSLVNKIAAGEVIERPASVVKELLENALDAGATRIDVALEEGGTQLIRVADNGSGVAAGDLPLAVAPHATSKLHTSDDLFNIRTLGFRGEALASIASVSRLRMASRTVGAIEGHEIICTDGQIEGPRPCAAPVGTCVEVRQLFFNVPARRKFLRQAPTELTNATEQLARLALAHPQVAFTLAHNDRASRNLPATADRRARIADFYGAELAECLIPIDREERGLRIEALIAPPAQSRASTKWQYLFLNGRFISDRRIGFAIREAFRGLVEHDRYPVIFIFLTTDPQAYDVNVHPTKIEVRWRDAALVQSQVLAILRETLLSRDLTPGLSLARSSSGAAALTEDDLGHQERTRAALADYLKSIDPTQARLAFQPPRFPSESVRPSISETLTTRYPSFEEAVARPTHSTVVTHSGEGAAAEQRPPNGKPVSGENESFEPPPANVPPVRTAAEAQASVIQVHNTYLVAQTEDGIIIVDQHALHERILYERFRDRILAGALESQRLLIAPTIEASAGMVQAAEHHRELLLRLGIELSVFGPTTLAVLGFPSLLKTVEPGEFVADLLEKLAEQSEPPSDETLLHQALDMMACKAAVKAGDPLTAEEMQALLMQRHLTDRSSNCPHGRPTTLQLSTRDLERQFKRV
ncbi:MAG TPA: DNA mismatch repair endonuclease MutL [Phycisphaerae bacterium]|nr:DNA mismatch repair endonuclease MutL [Phycisphaerae bacterium]